MEGLLTAFEMDLPEGVPESSREGLFDEFLRGYLSVRPLTPSEADVAWDIYTLYHSLWFTRIVYNENSLQKLLERQDFPAANALLEQIRNDLTRNNDGRFQH